MFLAIRMREFRVFTSMELPVSNPTHFNQVHGKCKMHVKFRITTRLRWEFEAILNLSQFHSLVDIFFMIWLRIGGRIHFFLGIDWSSLTSCFSVTNIVFHFSKFSLICFCLQVCMDQSMKVSNHNWSLTDVGTVEVERRRQPKILAQIR